MKTWLIRKGTSRMTVRAPDYWAARDRAAQCGFVNPDSIVLQEEKHDD